MIESHNSLRDAFWAQPPPLPEGIDLARVEPIAVARPGRGGTAVYDAVDLVTSAGRVPLLLGYQSRLLASQVEKLRDRLVALDRQRRERRLAEGARAPAESVPVIVTDSAGPSVVDACRRAGVGLLDQRGTLRLQAGGVFVFVEGKGKVERPWRGRLFAGKAGRIVRFLLTTVAFEPVTVPRTAQVIAAACELSYVYTHGVLIQLERAGFLERRSPHGGFRLRDPLGLLRAWIASGERTALAVEGFYAPATTRDVLLAAAQRLAQGTGNAPLFSLASALEPEEIHVGGLPQGAYWTGELPPLIEAFGLRRTTPHNFLVLRPDPVTWTTAGGLLMADAPRPAAVGADGLRRVSIAQLAADFATLPGRGREQAEFLVGVYAKRLPYRLDEP